MDFDKLRLQNIWIPQMAEFQTPLGHVYFCGFMNMFGAAAHDPDEAVSRMQVANESQVHYALNGAFQNAK